MDTLRELLTAVITPDLVEFTASGVKAGDHTKLKVRAVMVKDQVMYQVTRYKGTQVFHENYHAEELHGFLAEEIFTCFKQVQIKTRSNQISVLISKKGHVTIKKKQTEPMKNFEIQSHNRQKTYLLKEGTPVPFLVDLGVMTKEGKIVNKRYDKYRQINRFLEFIEDVLPSLDRDRELTIIDFGCGKSYLTFALYYYMKILKGYDIRVIGLDLKMDVINKCNQLSDIYGYDKLTFLHGDIAEFEGVDQVDMVVTLHACDTATDYALYKAVLWNAKVILSVPCCQHELNGKMHSDDLEGMMKYGLIKERLAALATDSMRALLLESMGYKMQILEFIDMEHTPKNILLRGVRQSTPAQLVVGDEYRNLKNMIHAEPTLYKLLSGMNQKKITLGD